MRGTGGLTCTLASALFLVVVLLASPLAQGEGPPPFIWIREFGSSAFDVAFGIAVDGSSVYVVGGTDGTLPGQANAGPSDAFVRKYDLNGNELWTRQFGTSDLDWADDVVVDGSGVYVFGETGGALQGQTSAGDHDAFLRKYDGAGGEVWTRQFGSSGVDFEWAAAIDGSGVYGVGLTEGTLPGQTSAGDTDAFVWKYDLNGNELWSRQFGTSGADRAVSVAVDASGVYVAGVAGGAFPGETYAGLEDAFVRKYDTAGAELWTRQFGTSGNDFGFVAVNGSSVYIGGGTEGALPGHTNAGGEDAFVRKYDTGGNEIWTRQFGTSAVDEPYPVTVDGSGVYLAGWTFGTLPGQTSAGDQDAFVRKYDTDGTEVWTRQFGTPGFERIEAAEVRGADVYVAGPTSGTFPGQTNAGDEDAFVTRLGQATPGPAPCPRSQGFWKTHPELWPVSILTLGNEVYDQAQLLALLRTPSRGDASVILAHQLIAAKLNVANGSDATPIASTIAESDDLLASMQGRLPLGVRASATLGRLMIGKATNLDAYNNGQLTPGCGAGSPAGTPAGSNDRDSHGDPSTDAGTNVPNISRSPTDPLSLGAWVSIALVGAAIARVTLGGTAGAGVLTALRRRSFRHRGPGGSRIHRVSGRVSALIGLVIGIG